MRALACVATAVAASQPHRLLVFVTVLVVALFVTTISADLALPAGNCQLHSPSLLQDSRGLIADGSEPLSPYLAGLKCLWVISPADLGPTDHVILTFVSVELAPDDRILVYDGSTAHDRALVTKLTSTATNSQVIGKKGTPLTIVFKTTDGPAKLEGFSAVFEVKTDEQVAPLPPPPPPPPPPVPTQDGKTSPKVPPKDNTTPDNAVADTNDDATTPAAAAAVADDAVSPDVSPRHDTIIESSRVIRRSEDSSNSNNNSSSDSTQSGILAVESSINDTLRHIRASTTDVRQNTVGLSPRTDVEGTCVNNCYAAYGHGKCVNGKCVCHSGFTGGDCHNDDIHILRTIFKECNGASWHSSTNWDIKSDTTAVDFHGPCNTDGQWHGVKKCISGRVIDLELAGNGLNCEVKVDPYAQQKLHEIESGIKRDSSFSLVDIRADSGSSNQDESRRNEKLLFWKERAGQQYAPAFPLYLQKLDASDNKINKFPLRADRMLSLSTLKMSGSHISGRIPVEVLRCPFLSILNFDLSENELIGELFEDVIWISKLSALNVENNNLEGFITDPLLRISQLKISGNTIWCPTPEGFEGECTTVATTDVSPKKGSMSGGEVVTIKGKNFPLYSEIMCGFDDTGSVAQVIDSTSLKCTVPAHIPGAAGIALYYKKMKFPGTEVPFMFTVECPEGAFIDMVSETRCSSCPLGGYCPGGRKPPISKAGYSSSPLNNATFQAFLPCFWPSACLSNDTCVEGYSGPRCSACTGGHVRGDTGCVPCGSTRFLYAFLIVAWIILMPLWWLRQAIMGSSLSSLGILVTFLQVVGLFHQYPIVWPTGLQQLLGFTSLTILNTDSLNLECALGLNFYGRLVFVWILPFVFATLCGVYVIYISYRQAKGENQIHVVQRYVRKWRSFVINGSISALTLLQIPLTDRSLRMFTCVKDDNDDRYYIASSPDVTCFTTEYYVWRPLAFISTIVYGLGIPFWFFYIMYRNKNRLLNVKVFRRYGSLYSNYAIRAWYWAPFSTLWSMGFTFIPALFRHVETEYVFLSIVMMYTNLFATMYFQPYSFDRNNHLTGLSWSVAIIFLISGLVMSWDSSKFSQYPGSVPPRGQSGIRQRESDASLTSYDEPVTNFDPNDPFPATMTPISDTNYVIGTTVTYLFFCNIALLLHGMMVEYQQYNYELWKTRPFISRIVASKVWQFIFPYDPTLKLERVDNPLVSPSEVGLPNIPYNQDFDDDFMDAPLPIISNNPRFEMHELDNFGGRVGRNNFEEYEVSRKQRRQMKQKRKGRGAKFSRLDSADNGQRSFFDDVANGEGQGDRDVQHELDDVYSDDLDSETLEGFQDYSFNADGLNGGGIDGRSRRGGGGGGDGDGDDRYELGSDFDGMDGTHRDVDDDNATFDDLEPSPDRRKRLPKTRTQGRGAMDVGLFGDAGSSIGGGNGGMAPSGIELVKTGFSLFRGFFSDKAVEEPLRGAISVRPSSARLSAVDGIGPVFRFDDFESPSVASAPSLPEFRAGDSGETSPNGGDSEPGMSVSTGSDDGFDAVELH